MHIRKYAIAAIATSSMYIASSYGQTVGAPDANDAPPPTAVTDVNQQAMSCAVTSMRAHIAQTDIFVQDNMVKSRNTGIVISDGDKLGIASRYFTIHIDPPKHNTVILAASSLVQREATHLAIHSLVLDNNSQKPVLNFAVPDDPTMPSTPALKKYSADAAQTLATDWQSCMRGDVVPPFVAPQSRPPVGEPDRPQLMVRGGAEPHARRYSAG